MRDELYYSNINEALYLAIIRNNVEQAKFLLKNGADANCKNKQQMTPLCWAAMLNSEKLFRLLLRYGAKSNVTDLEGKMPLHYAAFSGSRKIVDILLNATQPANINALDIASCTPLHYAAQEGQSLIVDQLLKNGADVDAKIDPSLIKKLGQWFGKANKQTATPLIKAINNNHTEIAQSLIKAGADVNAQDDSNNTALHYAVTLQDISLIVRLIQSNANVFIKNDSGYTPKEIVYLQNKTKVLAYLLRNMKEQLGWHTQLLHDAALWLTVLNGEERLVLFMLSQMHRAQKKSVMCSGYSVNLPSMIAQVFYADQSKPYLINHKPLPTEIWQRISAFWLRDTLLLNMSIERINSTMGSLFEHVNDFLSPRCHAL